MYFSLCFFYILQATFNNMNYTFLVIKKCQFSSNRSKEIKVGRDTDEKDFLI